MNVSPKDFAITAASGAGEVNTKTASGVLVHGLLALIGIKTPNALASFDITVYDSAGFLIYAATGLTGAIASVSPEKLCNSPLRLVLSNCTYDGAYSLRLYVRN